MDLKYERFFKRIETIIDCAIKKYMIDKDSLEDHGTIFYMNGNDSTLFDFEMNDRLCEFGVFHANGYYAVKVLASIDMTVVYAYPDAKHPQEHHKDILRPILEVKDLRKLATMIGKIEDGLEIGPETKDWNRPMSVLVRQLRGEKVEAETDEKTVENDCAITGLIMTFGEDDISLNILELPDEVADKVFELVDPYCTCSIRGSRESVAKEIIG